MDKPSLYAKYNCIQKNDANFVLDNYFRLVKWRPEGGDRILDVGCGTGDIINEYLIPLLPKSFDNLTGVDISQDMIEYAKSKCVHPKVAFRRLDIGSAKTPLEFEEAFDHAVSFYCLHWVQNQRQALINIRRMLKKGGDFLMTALANNSLYDVYYTLSKYAKWAPYMSNVQNFISPYHYYSEPHLKLEKLVSEAGFCCHVCHVKEANYVFPNIKTFENSMIAVNPFISKIPDNLRGDYLTDLTNEVRKLGFIITNNNNNDEKVRAQYKFLVVFASKPN